VESSLEPHRRVLFRSSPSRDSPLPFLRRSFLFKSTRNYLPIHSLEFKRSGAGPWTTSLSFVPLTFHFPPSSPPSLEWVLVIEPLETTPLFVGRSWFVQKFRGGARREGPRFQSFFFFPCSSLSGGVVYGDFFVIPDLGPHPDMAPPCATNVSPLADPPLFPFFPNCLPPRFVFLHPVDDVSLATKALFNCSIGSAGLAWFVKTLSLHPMRWGPVFFAPLSISLFFAARPYLAWISYAAFLPALGRLQSLQSFSLPKTVCGVGPNHR